MKKFITNNSHSETLLKWEHRTKLQLEDLRDISIRKATAYCKDLVKHRVTHVKIEKLEKSHVKELQEHIRELVQKSWEEGIELDNNDIETKFETKWNEWMKSIQCKGTEVHYPTASQIDKEITTVLKGMLHQNEKMIITKLKDKPLSQRGRWVPTMLKPNDHLLSRRWLGIKLNSDHHSHAATLSVQYFSQVESELNKIKQKLEPLNTSLVTKILRDLFDSIDKLNENKNSAYNFQPEFKVDIAISSCACIFKIFKENTAKVKLANDPVLKLENLKSTFLNTFKSQYRKVNEEKAAAANLCNLLFQPILKQLQGFLESEIVEDMIANKTFCHSKRAFKVQILTDLAEKNNFQLYTVHLSDIKYSMKLWAEYYVKVHCMESTDGKPKVALLSEKN